MGTEVFVDELPLCQITHEVPRPASYDAKTTSGPWAYLCEDCFQEMGVGLGTGKGQRLKVRS